ncbi:uncharacterized protein LOC108089282 [Drosophila ficusphila]|uniref:uncharacterized protein LOC108089282 n=1 Tax=Drosophila ficusphila TaxID=30025 RepID=UPI0007E71EC4|nr:uncharacterized protein LOC108089282 [Drosophila ficusphila]
MKAITDISHYDLFRILDFLKQSCELQNANESVAAIKYADIFNFAVTCARFKRIVWDWSRSMYDQLEIDLLHVVPHKHLTVKFMEIHKTLKRATKQKRDRYMDLYIRAMMGNPLLNSVELSFNTEEYVREHESIFEEILNGLQGKAERVVLDPDRVPKFKDFIFAGHEIRGLGLFRNIVKLSLTSSFEMFDLVEFCSRNPSLVTLEVNASQFSDHGKLTQIVGHCPNLKQLKFLLSTNIGDNGYVRLSLLDKLQKLEIGWKPVETEVNFLMPTFDNEGEEVMLKEWHSTQTFEMDEGLTTKRQRMDYEYEPPVAEVPYFEQPISVLQLLKAFSEKKKSKLIQLCLKFDVDDEMVQVISKIKGLRMLECGLCDPKSIVHLKSHPNLTRVSIRNKGHFVTEDIADLLKKQVTVSSDDSKLFLSPRGHLTICSKNAEIYRLVNFEPFLRLDNLKSLGLSAKMIVLMASVLHLFLERGVKIKSEACNITLDPETRSLKIIYDNDYLGEELPLPMVKNVRHFRYLSVNMPTSRLLLSLSTLNFKTLQELYISTPFTTFKVSEDKYLNQTVVKSLVTLSCLRKISCGYQKLKDIQFLGQLKDLEIIEVLSEHHPKNVNFPRFLAPILKNCHKLNSFQVNVPANAITKKFLNSLHYAVVANRDRDLNLILCLMWREAEAQMETALTLNEKQKTLIDKPYQLMKLRIKYVEKEYFFD